MVDRAIGDQDWKGLDRGATGEKRPRRNQTCRCGSANKYKRCCLERDQALRRQRRCAAMPAWILKSDRKLYQFEKYVCNVFALADLLKSLTDSRRSPEISTFDVVNSLFHTAVLRIPSINALEGDLKESDFQKLIGRNPTQDVKAFSADVVANVMDKLDLGRIRRTIETVIDTAQCTKALCQASYASSRPAVLDGSQLFSPYAR